MLNTMSYWRQIIISNHPLILKIDAFKHLPNSISLSLIIKQRTWHIICKGVCLRIEDMHPKDQMFMFICFAVCTYPNVDFFANNFSSVEIPHLKSHHKIIGGCTRLVNFKSIMQTAALLPLGPCRLGLYAS